jgi:hypothetical protein
MSADGELERQISAIWQDLLGLPRVGVQDNFFDLGGHSLLAVQAHSRIRRETGRDVSITDLFRFPTVRSLAGYMNAASKRPTSAAAAASPAPATGPMSRVEARKQAMSRRQPVR